jgi:hypothetical protein
VLTLKRWGEDVEQLMSTEHTAWSSNHEVQPMAVYRGLSLRRLRAEYAAQHREIVAGSIAGLA